MEPFAPQQILVGTDFSEISTLALRQAVVWAQRYHAPLKVLHVQEVPWITGDPYFGVYNLGELTDQARDALSQALAEHVSRHVPPDVSVSSDVVLGTPAALIEEYTASGPNTLVVLGTHGRGGLSRLLLGSVAERSLRMAQHPTLIVRQSPAAAASAELETPSVTHILCPVNFSEVARVAYQHAVSVAKTFGARLTAVFSVEEEAVTPEVLKREEERLTAWLPKDPAVDCEVRPMVRYGDAAEQTIALALEIGADLIVVGAQHRRFADSTVLGVTTVRVTRHAPCPVLVVPRPQVTQ